MAAKRRHSQTGLTLIELMIVVAILAIVSGFMVPLVSRHAALARGTAAKANLVEIRNAIVGTVDKPGFLNDVGRPPNSIAELIDTTAPSGVSPFNRDTGLGWRGPYLVAGGSSILDPWGNAIVIQRLEVKNGNVYLNGATTPISSTALPDGDYSRVISGGPNGRIDVSATDLLLSGGRADDLVLYLSRPDLSS